MVEHERRERVEGERRGRIGAEMDGGAQGLRPCGYEVGRPYEDARMQGRPRQVNHAHR